MLGVFKALIGNILINQVFIGLLLDAIGLLVLDPLLV